MASVMKEFEHLKIHLEEIKKATNSFSSKVLGAGGFGKVYEGEVYHSRGRSIVAIKRLNREFGQGDPEFFKEIAMLTRYTHKNLISLLGYCDEDGEKILVYEHESNGSLDHHLSSTVLTWTKRLKICLDVAKGLAYLHDHKGTQQRVIHRDIKSANILLDDNWNAKLSDMGLSKIGPANQPHSALFTNIVGTPGYCDPQYMVTYAITKESDIYSFGVVLFEVLCGRLCYKYTNDHPLEILVPIWKQSYINKKLDQIIFKDITLPMDPNSLKTFSEIAFQCLHELREQRPTMSLIMERLEIALEFQERFETEQYRLLSKWKAILLGKKEKEELAHLDGTMSFTFEDLFRELGPEQVMGESTYGTYYKGTLLDGDQVAVNRLRGNPTKSKTQIEVELNLLGEIRHPNLLVMRDYYLSPNLEEKFLAYDYMSKGSLATLLHVRRPKKTLIWATRMQIAKGVARGLHCLHTHHNIIHGNLASDNVFLDEYFNPKISDFGLLQLITVVANSNIIRGQELSLPEKADTKTDIYSLGVIMLELLTGKSPGDVDLPRWVGSVEQLKSTTKVFDLELQIYSPLHAKEMFSVLQLAMVCVSELPEDRPDIHQLLKQLYHIR